MDLHTNQIIKGNCLEILPTIPDDIIDLVITDPPFNVLNKIDIKFQHRADITQNSNFDNFSTYNEYLEFTKRWIHLVIQKMKKNSSLYIFCAAQYITDFMRICIDEQMIYKGILIWHKTNPAPKIRKSGYLSATELILFMVKGSPIFHFLGQNAMHNVINLPICMGKERLKNKTKNSRGKYPNLHPTQKPLEIYRKFIQVSSDPHNLVVDPFSGVGTVNIACKELHRYCLSIENNPTYYEAAIKRLINSS